MMGQHLSSWSITSHPGQWDNASRHRQCQICKKSDWCSYTLDGTITICRRIQGGLAKEDKSGTPYYIYHHNHGHHTDGYWISQPPQEPILSRIPQRADIETLDHVNLALLNTLNLSRRHHEDLRRRGLNEAHIKHGMFRTLPHYGRVRIASNVVDRCGETVCADVPGFYLKNQEAKRPYWTIAGSPGMLIPARDQHGNIVALQIRRDVKNTNRYSFFSSSRHGGPGAICTVHVPLHEGLDTSTIWITEGYLKADIATALSGELVLGLPSVGGVKKALPILESLQPSTVRLALDADARRNPVVARALMRAFATLKGGYCHG